MSATIDTAVGVMFCAECRSRGLNHCLECRLYRFARVALYREEGIAASEAVRRAYEPDPRYDELVMQPNVADRPAPVPVPEKPAAAPKKKTPQQPMDRTRSETLSFGDKLLFGRMLGEWMAAKGYGKNGAFGDAIGVTHATVSNYRLGKITPNKERMKAIFTALGVTKNEFWRGPVTIDDTEQQPLEYRLKTTIEDWIASPYTKTRADIATSTGIDRDRIDRIAGGAWATKEEAEAIANVFRRPLEEFLQGPPAEAPEPEHCVTGGSDRYEVHTA